MFLLYHLVTWRDDLWHNRQFLYYNFNKPASKNVGSIASSKLAITEPPTTYIQMWALRTCRKRVTSTATIVPRALHQETQHKRMYYPDGSYAIRFPSIGGTNNWTTFRHIMVLCSVADATSGASEKRRTQLLLPAAQMRQWRFEWAFFACSSTSSWYASNGASRKT